MKFAASGRALTAQRAEAWVLFAFTNGPVCFPRSTDRRLDARLRRQVSEGTSRIGFQGGLNEVGVIPCGPELPTGLILVIGLGKVRDFKLARLLQAASSAARAAARMRKRTIAFALDLTPVKPPIPADLLARVLLRGAAQGAYSFTLFKTPDASLKRARLSFVTLCGAPGQSLQVTKAVREMAVEAAVFEEIRDLANLPANEATPSFMAASARRIARQSGLKCEILDHQRLQKLNCNAILAVGRGSRHEPCIIRLDYRGARPGLRPLVLVGKTITFDSGGISLKSPKNMEWMKYDKCGGMAVLAALATLARLKTAHPIVGLLPVAENMPGGNAGHPGDIVRSRSGKTIEILNTDAEGRLLMADALSLAADLKPAAIVDLATLTGAAIVALGRIMSALLCSDARLRSQLMAAAEKSGDLLWPLPTHSEYGDLIKGQFADLKNVGNGDAGTVVGGWFLRQFVPEQIPYAHIDIAGTAYLEADTPYAEAGATLAGAKLLIEWVRALETTRE